MKTAKINLGKNRVILSDVLPYELPIIFSNRYFFNFLKQNQINIKSNLLIWKDQDHRPLDIMIALLFTGSMDTSKIAKEQQNGIKYNKINMAPKKTKPDLVRIPFQYEIQHKKDACRKLTLIHPFNQFQMVNFYESYQNIILYYCNKSTFSLRRPDHVARHYYYKDKLHKDRLSEEELGIEQYDKEYEKLKSFFVYEKYSNIHKFYDDFLFNRCEKKYDKMVKLDITKCFDSIYTHSLSWAIYGKTFVKDNLDDSKKNFAHKFDTLMQNMNYQETNGIVIGPEFSRIFAEMILQRVDMDLLKTLKDKGIREKFDYEIYRYVDDFFIFYNNEAHNKIIITELQEKLSLYKLYLNEAKQVQYEKPIISNISIAKKKITDLLDTSLAYSIEEKPHPDGDTIKTVKISLNSRSFITAFKSIIKENNIEYKDIINYTFSIIENKINRITIDLSIICREFDDLERNKNAKDVEKKLFNTMQNLLESITFIYSVSPRVNTTIRFSRIIKQIISFLRRKNGNKLYKAAIFEQIYNDILTILKKNKLNEYTQIETSYLLIILKDLGKSFYLHEDELASYFRIEKDRDENYTIMGCPLNYLSLMILLFYTNDKTQYTKLIDFLSSYIKEQICSKTFNFKKCDDMLLFLDTLSCPYIKNNVKLDILTYYGIDPADQDSVINLRKSWFISWKDFNFKKELDIKKGQEVY